MDPNAAVPQSPIPGTSLSSPGGLPIQTIPTVNQTGPVAPMKSGGSKMKMIIIIIFLIVGILIVGGFVAYSVISKKDPNLKPPSASEGAANELISETDNLEIKDVDGEFLAVDQEIVALEATPSAKSSPLAQ